MGSKKQRIDKIYDQLQSLYEPFPSIEKDGPLIQKAALFMRKLNKREFLAREEREQARAVEQQFLNRIKSSD